MRRACWILDVSDEAQMLEGSDARDADDACWI